MPDYKGMTVNERLFVAGLLEIFENAAKSRQRQQMISILLSVELTPDQAQQTTDTVLRDSQHYGF